MLPSIQSVGQSPKVDRNKLFSWKNSLENHPSNTQSAQNELGFSKNFLYKYYKTQQDTLTVKISDFVDIVLNSYEFSCKFR